MTVEDPPFVLQSDAHPAAVFRHMIAGLFGQPVASHTPTSIVSTGGGGNGVLGPTDLVVTQNGTPNMTVNVSAGTAVIRGSEASTQGAYVAYNNGTVNMAIGTADGTNPRNDIVVMQARDSAFSGAQNDARLFVVAGTPAASPADPSLPANCVALARVRVNAGASSITNANITDLRRSAYAAGGICRCTSTTRPTGAALFEGLVLYETDTDCIQVYDGAAFMQIGPLSASTPYTPTLIGWTLGNGTLSGGYTKLGRWLNVFGHLTIGSTTSGFATPLQFAAVPGFTLVSRRGLGVCTAIDVSAGTGYYGQVQSFPATITPSVVNGSAQSVLFQTNAPFTWAVGDEIDWQLWYEVTT